MAVLNELKAISRFTGMEFGKFKIKTGASEDEMIQAASEMEQEFLSQEDGFLGHAILKGRDGSYVDMAFATSQEKAEEICGKWMVNEFALKYLEFMEPDSADMSFWTRIK